MGRALDVLAGLIVGGITWVFLNVILGFIPFVGWMLAAIIGGYIAGRLGGEIPVIILAFLSPLVAAAISIFLIGLIPFGLARQIAGLAAGTLIIIAAVINLIFVGIGGYIGSKAYKPERCPYCGNRVSKGALVCASCGRELRAKVASPKGEAVSPEAYQARVQPVTAQPIGVEIQSKEKPIEAEKKPSSLDQLIAERDETLVLLENLKKRLIDGKISEETYKELRKELEEKLRQLDEKIRKAKEGS